MMCSEFGKTQNNKVGDIIFSFPMYLKYLKFRHHMRKLWLKQSAVRSSFRLLFLEDLFPELAQNCKKMYNSRATYLSI
jgi:hypothetical protein